MLEDDRLAIDLSVRGSGTLTVRSAAAQLAFPCLCSGSTALDMHAVLSDGVRLGWRPAPLVAAAGCRPRSTAARPLA